MCLGGSRLASRFSSTENALDRSFGESIMFMGMSLRSDSRFRRRLLHLANHNKKVRFWMGLGVIGIQKWGGGDGV